MSITAIAPVWNGRPLLERLLGTLQAQTAPAAEVLAVDNGSTDGAPELALRRGARVISMGRNAGFVAAVNRGIRESRTEWIAVLNTDVELAPDYFAKLRDAVEASGAWFATGKLLNRAASVSEREASGPGRESRTGASVIDATFDAVCRGGTAYRVGNGRPDGPAFSIPRSIWSAPFTAALFRAELFQRVGLLEETFESYLEDVDFGLRCASAGLSGVYAPEAVAWHRGSASLGRWNRETVRRIARNQVWLLARHYPASLLRRWWWPVLVAHGLWGGVAARHGAGMAWIRGLCQGIAGFRSARRQAKAFSAVEALLRANERSMLEFHATVGSDFYWRMYFLLTGGGAK